MDDPHPRTSYRFGSFEADTGTGELRKQGMRVRVNVQPFQVLVMLLERPRELVTREEIARRLWPDGTFVDYEHGVNSAVNRLRDALGDKARDARFIETLARRGYRFVAPVQRIEAVAPAADLMQEIENAGVLDRYLASPEELPRTPLRTVRTLFVLLQLMYLGFYFGALANVTEIEDVFSVLPHATEALVTLVVTAALLIPVRTFLLCAVLFHAPRIKAKFLRIWPFLLPFDVLWALSPFLLAHHINLGLALGCMAPLVYSPFAQRALMVMGAGERSNLRE